MVIRNQLLHKTKEAIKEENFPFISVIIPTCNRGEILKKCLDSLFSQSYQKSRFEIIIIDDGSKDQTKKEVKKISLSSPVKINYFFQKNKGPAAARNLGIKKSNGQIVLIINDDTIANKNLILEHALSHLENPEEESGVLGYVTWSSNIKITPFMKWLENGGPQFSYKDIKGRSAKWWHLWTCNISFKKNYLLNYGLFDESFPYAAWEDVELGYRLSKYGFKLAYNKNAIGYHFHPTNLPSVVERMKKHGASAVVLGKKVNDPTFRPPLSVEKIAAKIDFIDRIVFNRITEFLVKKIAEYSEERFPFGFIYNLLLLHYRVVGRREFLKKNA